MKRIIRPTPMPGAAEIPPRVNDRAVMELKRSILRKINARMSVLRPLERTRSA